MGTALTTSSQAASWPLRTFFLRLAALATLLAAMALHFGTQIGDALIPAFKAEIQWLDDHYRVDSLSLDHEGADQVFRLEVGQAQSIVLNGQVFYPDPRGKANASTLLGNAILPTAMLIALAMSWPPRLKGDYLYRIGALLLALPLLLSIDVPMVLWASIWSLHVNNFAPDLVSPLLIWLKFLQNGGRLACPLVLGVMVIAITGRISLTDQS
jgi:hypothetical protein